MDVTMAVQGHGRPCLLSSSYCRLTLGRPLFRPPSTARRRIETLVGRGKMRMMMETEKKKKVSSHAPRDETATATARSRERGGHDTYSTKHMPKMRGQHIKPRSLGFDNCFSHLSRGGSPFRLTLGSACALLVLCLFTKSYDVCWWELDLSPASMIHLTDPCAAVLIGIPLTFHGYHFAESGPFAPPLSSLPMTKRLSKGGKR